MRLRVDLGRTGSPVLLGARGQHEQRCEHRNGDERNGRDEQHGGRDQKDRGQREKNCSERQGYSESKNDVSFLHAASSEQLSGRPRKQTWERLLQRAPDDVHAVPTITEPAVSLTARADSELLLFDLAERNDNRSVIVFRGIGS